MDYGELNRALQTSLQIAESMSGIVKMLGEVTIINRVRDYIYLVRRDANGVHLQVALKGTRLAGIIEAKEAALFQTKRLQPALSI